MTSLPSGTVTFLFTDIEGSTKLWDSHTDQMREALARHDALLHQAIEAAGGVVFKTVGDAFCAAFETAPQAIAAAIDGQRAFTSEVWPEETPLRVRMALHTGVPQQRDGDYFGPVVNRVARLLAAGHGGQIVVSAPTYELTRDQLPRDITLHDLGSHRLKDLTRPEHVFQVRHPALPDRFAPLRTLEQAPNNLPRQLNSFIGREKELDAVATLLENAPLVTLTGAGGCGKSRLALQAATNSRENYPDGVWLIELASLSDAELVTRSVASVLEVKEQTGVSLLQTMVEHCKTQRLLLLIDNCEHLLPACATLVSTLLRSCPHLHLLVTSREPLGIVGEQAYRVPSLSLPSAQQRTVATAQSLSQFEAVRLFVARARAVKPDFVVTDGNAPALAQLCYHLDGIPLAIELAAARIRSLTVEQVNDKLDARFRLLTGGDKSALPRQQTLQALVDWSYDLLGTTEKALLARLSVFAGGWTLEAAEAVCGFGQVERDETLDLLTSLVDKSLVNAQEDGAATRYELLETLRRYAAEKLETNGEIDSVRTRHRDWFVAFAEQAEPMLNGPDQEAWLERTETEHDNLRAALAQRVEENDNTETKEARLRLVVASWRFWYVRGYYSEGRACLARVLDGAQELRAVRKELRGLYAKALRAAGVLAMVQGDYTGASGFQEEALRWYREANDKKGMATVLEDLGFAAHFRAEPNIAQTRLEESLALKREIGDKQAAASTLLYLARLTSDAGNYDAAQAQQEEALTLYRELGDKDGIASVLNNLGLVAHQQGDLDTARMRHEEALVLCRETGNVPNLVETLNHLGFVASAQGDFDKAQVLHEESLTLCRRIDNKQRITDTLEGIAVTCLQQGAVARAVVLWAATNALRDSLGAPLPPNRQMIYRQQLDEARASLGVQAYQDAWQQGANFTLEQTADYAANR